LSLESRQLSAVVRAEAFRAVAESRIRPDPDRLSAGWQRRFVVEARRIGEYIRLYEAAGFEVAADPVKPEQVEEECGDCRLVLSLEFRTIYTRRGSLDSDSGSTNPDSCGGECV
jgi:hypothetical protein